MPYRDVTYGRTFEDIRRLPAMNPLERQHAVVLRAIDALSLADASTEAVRLGMDDGVEYVLGAVDLLCEQTGIEMETTPDGTRTFCITEKEDGT